MRATSDMVADWRIPEAAKRVLTEVGVPVDDQLIEHVDFQQESEPTARAKDGRAFYRATRSQQGEILPNLTWMFVIEPNTGKVFYLMPDGEPWFANSSADDWIRALHHYGRHVTTSQVLSDDDGDEGEQRAELALLAQEIAAIDPPAFQGYIGYFWPEFLDRWLW